MYCKKCGTQVDESVSFCPNCGTSLKGHGKKTKKKKPSFLVRFLTVLLTLIIVIPATLLCIAILSDTGDPETVQSEENASNSASFNTEYNADMEVPATEEANAIEADYLVDNETFTAEYIGSQDGSGLGVFYVTLKIQNKSDVEVLVSVEDADVDGETVQMVMTGVPLVIKPGNSGQTGFIFPMSNLSITSMDQAEKATFRIVLRDNNSLGIIAESDYVTVDLIK